MDCSVSGFGSYYADSWTYFAEQVTVEWLNQMRYEKEAWYSVAIIVVIIGIVAFLSDPFAGVVVIVIGFIFIWFIRRSSRIAGRI